MLVSDFDYDLPADRIADRPAPRGTSRLLVVDRPPAERHRRISDLPALLRASDLVVVNDTRVIPARLFARRAGTGGRVELLLVEQTGEGAWRALAKPGRKARPGTRLELDRGIEATITGRGEDGVVQVEFSPPVEPHLEAIGHVPLPPYIKRPDEPADHEVYQTVFADRPGAIAAPTAGLHFSRELLTQLEAAGIGLARITLDVGIGTFKPVTAQLAHEHQMDRERYRVGPEAAAAIEATRARGGRIVAVGTTVVRTLESVAAETGGPIVPAQGSTELFIRPGHRFRAVDLLLTNFHLPRSTLLMLVSALAGRERVLAAYHEAIDAGYRFYSYGDAMLLERTEDGSSAGGALGR